MHFLFWMPCNITTSLQVTDIFTHFTQRKKKGGKNVVNLVLLTKKAKNAFNLPHIVENNVK